MKSDKPTKEGKITRTHLPVLDCLRGFAALSVCLFHFSNGNVAFLSDDSSVKSIGSFGWLGVEAFFVISGFVIPYSMYLRSYTLQDGISFIGRRLKRLEPPYLATIALVVFLGYLSSLSSGFQGEQFRIDWAKLLAHLGYLNSILELGWINPVFWTLGIEFQFYLFIALAFPVLSHSNLYVRSLSVVAIALLGLLPGFGNAALLPHWLPLFAIGLVTCQSYLGELSQGAYLNLFTVICLIAALGVGMPHVIAGAATALIIRLVSSRKLPRFLEPVAWIGTISYSLYLLHVPIGMRIINLSARLPETDSVRYLAIIVAFVVSVLASVVFWFAIERTSQRWSKSEIKLFSFGKGAI